MLLAVPANEVLQLPALPPGVSRTLQNLGVATVYYGDQNVSQFRNAGSIAPGATVVLTGNYYLYASLGSVVDDEPAMRGDEPWQEFGVGLPLSVSPMSFGATGGADDSGPIQAAINASQNGVGEVLIDRPYNLRGILTYDVTKPFSMRFTGAGKLTWLSDLGIAAPASPSATAVGSGGTFAAATYFWKITALNANGEGIASTEVSAAIVLNGSCNLAWTAVPGATSYRVYRGTVTAGQDRYYTLGNVTAFTDTNAAVTATNVHAPTQGRVYALKATGTWVDNGLYPTIVGGRMIGPGGWNTGVAAGTRPALMHGVQCSPKMVMENFVHGGFNAGYTLSGDHQKILNGASRGNYIGEYFEPDPINGFVGDQLIEGVEMSNNGLCSCMISPATNPMYNTKHQRNHLGWGPTGIYVEALPTNVTPPGSYSIGFSIFDNDFFENVGNAMFYSESSSNNCASLQFNTCPGTWSGSPWVGLTAGWNVWNMGTWQDITVISSPCLHNPGTAGCLKVSIIERFEWFNGQSIVDNITALIPLLSSLDAKNFYIYGTATYRVMVADTSTLAGDLMQANGLSGQSPYATRYVAAAVGSQAPIVGVAAQACPNIANSTFVPVAISGRRPVRNVVATTAKQFLVPSTVDNGAVVSQAAAPGAGAQLVGIALAAAGANTTTDCLINGIG